MHFAFTEDQLAITEAAREMRPFAVALLDEVATGKIEAVVTFIVLETGLVPGTLNADSLDPACGPQIQIDNRTADVRVALSNSFGFGGSNTTLVLRKAA